MARTVHDPERAELDKDTAADFDAIRRLAGGKTLAIPTFAYIDNAPSIHPYYFRGILRTDFEKRHLVEFALDGHRLAGVYSLTPDNRFWFLYDRSVYEAVLTRYERRAERSPVLQSPNYEVHFIISRNEGGGGELLYFRRECPPTIILWRQPKFFLHVHPVDTELLPADRRRHGFENRDFDFQPFWRRNGKCYAVRSLPDYGIASIHTGQFHTRRDEEGIRRYENVWAGSFSPGDLDGPGGGAPPR